MYVCLVCVCVCVSHLLKLYILQRANANFSLLRHCCSVYRDLRQLIEVAEGMSMADVRLVGDDGGDPVLAHRCCLYLISLISLIIY